MGEEGIRLRVMGATGSCPSAPLLMRGPTDGQEPVPPRNERVDGVSHLAVCNRGERDEGWRMSNSKNSTRLKNGSRVREAALLTPTDLGAKATRDISGAMNAVLADVFALYLKTKNFHWHMSGPHFRDYHLMLDDQSDQIFAMTDPVAERVRKIGGMTIRSIGHIARLQRISDNDADYVEPLDMLAELREDNQTLISKLREAHEVCEEHNDVATASLIENWIDESERRHWFLFETCRNAKSGGH